MSTYYWLPESEADRGACNQPGDLHHVRSVAEIFASCLASAKFQLNNASSPQEVFDALLWLAMKVDVWKHKKPTLERVRTLVVSIRGRHGQLGKPPGTGGVNFLFDLWEDLESALLVDGIFNIWEAIRDFVPGDVTAHHFHLAYEQHLGANWTLRKVIKLSKRHFFDLPYLPYLQQSYCNDLATFEPHRLGEEVEWEMVEADIRLSVGQELPPASASPADGNAGDLVPLKPEDETILETLCKVHPVAMEGRDIETEVNLQRKTATARFKYLEGNGLIKRPFGERSGFVITEFGKKHIEHRTT